jgi:hypothetical protein
VRGTAKAEDGMDEKSDVTPEAKRRSRTLLYAAVGAGALLTLIAARPITAAIQNSAGGFHHSWRGHWGGGGGATSPEAAKEHLQTPEVDAARHRRQPEQQDKINGDRERRGGRPLPAPRRRHVSRLALGCRRRGYGERGGGRSASRRWGWRTRPRSASYRPWPMSPTP